VCEYFPGVDHINERQMALYIRCCDSRDALDAYRHYLKKAGTSSLIERFLVDVLMIEQCWECLDKFDASLPLKKDSEPVQKSIPDMMDGRWEKALELLKPVPRVSPYALVKLFCRAMVSFYNEDDSGVKRAISMIPKDFCLYLFLSDLLLAITSPTGNLATK
jgi:hypothetical protein